MFMVLLFTMLELNVAMFIVGPMTSGFILRKSFEKNQSRFIATATQILFTYELIPAEVFVGP